MDKEQLKKILTKADSLQKGKEIAYAKEFVNIDEKIDNLSEELKKKLDEELFYEVDEQKIVDSVFSKVKIPEPIKGEDGKDYILTEKDKKEIAKSIEVPERIVEKVEVIRETPIIYKNITNEIKEVALYEKGEDIADKLEELKGDKRLDKKAIKGLDEIEKQILTINSRPVISGGITQARVLQLIDENTTDATFASITGLPSDNTALQSALDLKYSTSNPAGYITLETVKRYQLLLG